MQNNSQTPPQPLIRATALKRVYPLGDGQVVGLRGVDFEVQPGDFVVLKGVSGSGKSTLLSLLAGLDRPSAGELQVAGRDLTLFSEAELVDYRRQMVGMVFQSFNLLPTLSVLENVALPALLGGAAPHAAQARAKPLLQALGLAPRQGQRPDQLSGGEMQRVAIARALINDPRIILADEPTGNLDSRNGRRVMELLGDLNRKGRKTVLIATHGTQADTWATRNLRLRDGVLI
ncbi:MAG: ABC transporter ATP-binding protein [Desulfobacterales bacterium]